MHLATNCVWLLMNVFRSFPPPSNSKEHQWPQGQNIAPIRSHMHLVPFLQPLIQDLSDTNRIHRLGSKCFVRSPTNSKGKQRRYADNHAGEGGYRQQRCSLFFEFFLMELNTLRGDPSANGSVMTILGVPRQTILFSPLPLVF